MENIDWNRVRDIARVLSCVEFPETGTGCWVYTGKSVSLRYKGRREYVYRIVVMALYDVSLSSNDFICHQCDNPRCVNPDHLVIGDVKRNAVDRQNIKIPQVIRLLRDAGYVVTKAA